MEDSKLSEDIVESRLEGNTLRVYWHLLRAPNGVAGVRETQRSLGFSSPALAVYHLESWQNWDWFRRFGMSTV